MRYEPDLLPLTAAGKKYHFQEEDLWSEETPQQVRTAETATILLIRRARGAVVETYAIHLKDTAAETAVVLAETAAVLEAKTAADNKLCKNREST